MVGGQDATRRVGDGQRRDGEVGVASAAALDDSIEEQRRFAKHGPEVARRDVGINQSNVTEDTGPRALAE